MSKKFTTQEFIIKANYIHNNFYNYSKVKYINIYTKVIIICPKHGHFWQRPNDHINNKNGCPKCKFEKLSSIFQKDLQTFTQQANKIHNNFYNYSQTIYKGTNNKIKINCPIHGCFLQTPHNHLNGQGCPRCRNSKGEKQIENYLIENNIKFIPQKRFKDCRNKRPLPFDFYLPELNTCIEYDGRQHYDSSSKYYSKQIIINDIIKTKYCQENNVSLIRITNNIQKSISHLLK